MGAVAPVCHWIPEDDLLLKNAVEAGASLESLAKGAVQFSRKFTVRELQDRWYSLLYDPVISAEAAFRMTELERSNPSLSVKFGRTANSKEGKSAHAKRKAESVRASYHALRKKIRNEPFNPMDLSFLVAPNGVNYAGNENEDPSSNHLCLEQSHLDIINNAFPEILADAAPREDGSQNFHTGFPNSFGGMQDEVPHIPESNLMFPGNVASGVSNLGMQNELVGHSQPEKACSNFVGNQEFNPLLPESGTSLENFEDSSVVPAAMREGCDDDAKTSVTSADEAVLAEETMKLHTVHHESKAATAGTDCYLAELSNSLLNGGGVFIYEDDKVMTDKSYYDGLSLLLNSPSNCSQVTNPVEAEKFIAPDDHRDSFEACDKALDENKMADDERINVISNSEPQPSSSVAPALDPHPEIQNGIICCTLNTEDPDIPWNDDILLSNQRPFSITSLARRNFTKASNPMPTSGRNNLAFKERAGGYLPSLPKDQKIPEQSQSFPQNMSETTKVGFTFNFPDNDLVYPALKSAGTSFGPPALRVCSTNPSRKLETQKTTPIKNSSENPPMVSDASENYSQEFGDSKSERGVLAAEQNECAKNREVDAAGITKIEMEINPIPELDDDLIESDDEVPCYSDIEAMILDMDLDPDDQDGFEFQVMRYQNEETKRAIIRLEQAAHSYMQRAIASHGAFAVFYGRNSKHYIKKPEVLLGRSTEDFTVDIDLGREVRGNKVSRRQAILRLSDDGSFHLKNLGKFPISVNDKEVDPGQSSVLLSNCLIEIRGMPFIFETNEIRAKEHLQRIQNQPSSRIKVEQSS